MRVGAKVRWQPTHKAIMARENATGPAARRPAAENEETHAATTTQSMRQTCPLNGEDIATM